MDGRITSYSFKTLVVSTRADKGERIQFKSVISMTRAKSVYYKRLSVAAGPG